MEPDEFARALRAGELTGLTVVVKGAIVPGPSVPRPACFPRLVGGQSCYLGELQGVDPALQVMANWSASTESEATATFRESGIEWPFWSLPQAPITGHLVLSVPWGAAVEYVGRARSAGPGSELNWSVREARAIEPQSLDLDEILLVDGWLTGFGGTLSCLAPPSDLVRGLPNRWCANSGWLMDRADRSVFSDADQASGIELQHNAYYEFAPGPWPQVPSGGDPEPREGTYAIGPRLEGLCADGNAPCWYWQVVGRDGPVDSFHVSSRTIECVNLAAGWESTGGGIAVSVIDETGLVRNCLGYSTILDGPPVIIANPLPNTAQLEVSWLGGGCDVEATFTLRRSGGSFDLSANPQPGDCDEPARHVVSIGLEEAIPADAVTASVAGIVAVPPPSEPLPERAWVPCTTTTDDYAGVFDATGFIDACRTVDTTVLIDGIAVADSDGAGVALRVFWSGSRCDGTPSFVLRPNGLRFSLQGRLYGEPCGPTDVPYEIQLDLNTDLFAAFVDASLERIPSPAPTPPNQPQVSTDISDTDMGRLEITLKAGQGTYAAGEAIDIDAELAWEGPPGFRVEIFAARSSDVVHPIHFGWEQLDGDMRVGPPIQNRCDPYVLRSGRPLAAAFTKESGTFGDREHDEFWGEYFASPELRLPPGRFRVGARVQFAFSAEECSSTRHQLLAFITINVTE
jgi:hypothetical protein